MSALRLWQDFFLKPESAQKAALFRIVFGCVLFLVELLPWPYLRLFYTNQGFFTGSQVASLAPGSLSILYYLDQPLVVYGLYGLLLLATLGFILGIYSQFLSVLIYILYMSFYNRFGAINYGGTKVIEIMLFFLLFLPTDRAFILPWYAKRHLPSKTVPAWPIRLMQLQVASIYLLSGLAKLRSDLWFNEGRAMLYVLNQSNIAYFNFSWLAHAPFLVGLITYFTIIAELSFAVLVWFPQTRRTVLVMIVALHLGILLMINVTYFSEIMIACLLLFTSLEDWQLLNKLKNSFVWRRLAVH